MTRQTFKTRDVLKLEIGEAPATGPKNAIKNYTANLGTWGWVTPLATSKLDTNTNDTGWNGLNQFQLSSNGTVASSELVYTQTEWIAVKAGQWVRGSIFANSPLTGRSGGLEVRFVRSDRGAETGATAQVAIPGGAGSGARYDTVTAQAPANTTHAVLRVSVLGNALLSRQLNFSLTMLAVGDSSAEVAAYPMTVPYTYTDVLGPSYEITVDRAALSLGTLTAKIADTSLDPATDTLIRPGHPVRLLARDASGGSGTYVPIFTGEILNGKVAYALTRREESKRADITLTATDAAKNLANLKQPQGVASVSDLRWVMEGTGTPFSVNGTTSQPGGPPPATVATNDNASVLDQVAMTRDSRLGYAWVSRYGVLHVRDANTMPTYTRATLTESVYNADLALDFDTERCINVVTIKRLVVDAEGKTITETYGPYTDDQSIAKWGPRSAEFTMQGITAAEAPTRAAAILTANANPKVTVNGLTIPITGLAEDLVSGTTTGAVERRAHLDIYDRVRITNTRAALDQTLRITGLKHRITPNKWLTDLAFASTSGVAMPSAAPELPAPSPTFPDTPWANLPLVNGWAAYGGGFQAPQYRRKDGIVYLRGLLNGAARTSNVVCNIPVGFRHSAGTQLWVCTSDGGSSRMDTSGGLGGDMFLGGGLSAYVSLSGISYPAEA